MTFRTHVDSTFVRDELRFSVRRIPDEDPWASGPPSQRRPLRWQELLETLAETRRPTIVYASSRRDCDDLSSELTPIMGEPCIAYHAGLSDAERLRRERAFLGGDVQLIVATNAFGMGIDKDDVRSVIHWQTPASPEALYQEAGRAGRGTAGQPADAVLLFSEDDLNIAYRMIRRDIPTRAEIRRADIALGEIAEHAQSTVAMVTDDDLSRLAVLRQDVQARVVIAHLEGAGLVRQIDRLYGARTYRVVGATGPTTSLEDTILSILGPLGAVSGLVAADVVDESPGTNEKEVRDALVGMERRGLIERSRHISVTGLMNDPCERIEQVRSGALHLWNALKDHQQAQGKLRFLRGAGAAFGDGELVVTAAEVLAAFGLIDARYEDETGQVPALRLARHSDTTQFHAAIQAARALPPVLVSAKTMYRLSDLTASIDMSQRAVLDGLTLIHLIGAGSVDLRSWEDGPPVVTRRIKILELANRDGARAAAQHESMARGRTQRLRLETLRRYAYIDAGEPGVDAHQAYLARYLTEPDFLEEVARGSAEDLLQGLTPAQREVVEANTERVLVVLAGPGTGKTRTVVNRIAYRVRSAKVLPENILAVTFTRAGTEEVRARLAQLAVRGVRARTLHSVAVQLVMANWRALGFPAEPGILTDKQRLEIVRRLGSPQPNRDMRAIDTAAAKCEEPATDISQRYAEYLIEAGALDFGRALSLAAGFLADGEQGRHVLDGLHEIVVDEFQDLSPAQLRLVRALAGSLQSRPDRAHVTVVGDPRQAIYEWNGADAQALISLHRSDTTASIDLAENFRSGQPILDLANRTISEVLPELPPVIAALPEAQGAVVTHHSDSPAEMHSHLVATVQRWIADGIPDDEIAVLAFRGKVVAEIGAVLSRARVAFHDVGLPAISSTDVFNLVSAAVRDLDLGAVPDETTPLELLDHVGGELASELGDEESEARDDWERLRAAVSEHLDRGSPGISDALIQVRRTDEGPRSRAGVTVSTMHKAKGLEWQAVAVTDVSSEGLDGPVADQERCRLLYVALTRAKHHLDISWHGMRSQWMP